MRVKELIEATRPKTLFASLGPVLVGLSLSGTNTIKDQKFIALAIIIVALSLQVAANLSNDFFDFKNRIDDKSRLGPKRASSQTLSAHDVKRAFRASFVISAIFGFYLTIVGGVPILIIGILSILFAYFYTGGPWPLSYHSFGEILALIFFGPVAVWGTWFLMTDRIELLPAIVGLGPGFIAWSLMATNNMRDRVSDLKAGKLTLAVLVGEKASRLFVLVGILLSIEAPFYLSYAYDNNLLLLSSLVFIPFFKTWLRIALRPVDSYQNKSLVSISYYLIFYCAVLSAVFLGSVN